MNMSICKTMSYTLASLYKYHSDEIFYVFSANQCVFFHFFSDLKTACDSQEEAILSRSGLKVLKMK